MTGGDILVSLVAGLGALFLAWRGVRGAGLSRRGRLISAAVWAALIVILAVILS